MHIRWQLTDAGLKLVAKYLPGLVRSFTIASTLNRTLITLITRQGLVFAVVSTSVIRVWKLLAKHVQDSGT